MPKRTAILLVLALVSPLAGCASKGESAAAAPPGAAVASNVVEGKDRVERTQSVRMTAVVDAIDLAKREVTLHGPSGRKVTMAVDESVVNLPQVKVGDEVAVTYFESLVFQLRKPGQATPGAAGGAAVERAAPGQKPAGSVHETVSVTTTVEAIDKAAKTLTLKMADGETRTLEVQNPANLEKVKVGDLLEITYTKALAIAVEAPSAAR